MPILPVGWIPEAEKKSIDEIITQAEERSAGQKREESVSNSEVEME
jgi:hypothetical protein